MKYYLLSASIFILALGGCKPSENVRGPASTPTASSAGQDLAQARQAFTTNLKSRMPAPHVYQNEKPPAGVKEVEYTSGNLKLKGWLSANANDGKKHPAVVYLHGGFAFGSDDWEDASPFVQAGFVLFMPMLRGENGNPGHHESFYGEVDDAVAAGRYLATLPNVDANNIFVTGHSVGGGLTCLVSMMPSPYKAAASFDGATDMRRWSQGAPDEMIPYDRSNSKELELRNPYAFTASIRIPLKLYAGPDVAVYNLPFAVRAQQIGKDCELVDVSGDHHTMVKPAVEKAIVWFRELTGK